MKSPEEIVIDLMNETPEETGTRRALAKAQRESIEDSEDKYDEQLSGEQGFKPVHRRNDAWDMSDKDYL